MANGFTAVQQDWQNTPHPTRPRSEFRRSPSQTSTSEYEKIPVRESSNAFSANKFMRT
jgi:hypothetical protein